MRISDWSSDVCSSDLRVRTAAPSATDGVEFALGGFELAGLRPVLVRAFNVLRQYPVTEVDAAWAQLRAGLAPGGLVVDGTCDELGRLCCWVLLDADGPVSLTLACDPFALERPSDTAERLPKGLIPYNVEGRPIPKHGRPSCRDRVVQYGQFLECVGIVKK